MNVKRGAAVAAAVAGLLAVGCGGSDEKPEPTGQQSAGVKCQGINDCKGMSECASTDGNACQGQNECAGMGWITVDTEQACTDAGGTVVS